MVVVAVAVIVVIAAAGVFGAVIDMTGVTFASVRIMIGVPG
jgi:hypothetical protein